MEKAVITALKSNKLLTRLIELQQPELLSVMYMIKPQKNSSLRILLVLSNQQRMRTMQWPLE